MAKIASYTTDAYEPLYVEINSVEYPLNRTLPLLTIMTLERRNSKLQEVLKKEDYTAEEVAFVSSEVDYLFNCVVPNVPKEVSNGLSDVQKINVVMAFLDAASAGTQPENESRNSKQTLGEQRETG